LNEQRLFGSQIAASILILHFGCLAEAAASSFADVAGGQENGIVTGPQTFSDKTGRRRLLGSIKNPTGATE
jgi:hypothetical protein